LGGAKLRNNRIADSSKTFVAHLTQNDGQIKEALPGLLFVFSLKREAKLRRAGGEMGLAHCYLRMRLAMASPCAAATRVLLPCESFSASTQKSLPVAGSAFQPRPIFHKHGPLSQFQKPLGCHDLAHGRKRGEQLVPSQ
jgi:hypothetical protein